MEDNPVLIYPVDDEDRNTENESKLSKGILKKIQNYFSVIIRRSIKSICFSQIYSPGLFTRPFCNVLVSAVVMCLIYSAFFPGGGLLDIVVKDGRNSDDGSVGFTSQGKNDCYLLTLNMN